MTSSPRLGDHTLEFINLRLRTSKCTEPLLRQLAGTLVFAVTEEFNNTTLIRRKAKYHYVSYVLTSKAIIAEPRLQ